MDFLEQMRLEMARERAEKSLSIAADRLEDIRQNPPARTGMASGKYPEIRAVLKTQRAAGGIQKDPTLPKGSAGYIESTRQIKMHPSAMVKELRRHEGFHDIQNVGRRIGQPITSPMERLAWGRGPFGQIASEFQAYAAQHRGPWGAVEAMARNAPLYIDDPAYKSVRPAFKALNAGRDLLPAAARLGKTLARAAGPVGWAATAGEFIMATQPSMEKLQNQPSWATQMGQISPPPNLPQY